MNMEKLQSAKFIKIFMMIYLIGILVICFFVSKYEMRVEEFDVKDIPIKETGVKCEIDTAYNDPDGKCVVIEGWCVILGQETKPVSMHVLLRNDNSGVYLKMPTTIVSRVDVTEALNDGVNYDNSGYSVNVNSEKIDFTKNKFEICILYECGKNKCIVHSGKYVEKKEGNIE